MDKRQQDIVLLQTARLWAIQSYCERLKVGAVISRNGRIMATGFNGTLPGADNDCECDGATKDSVVHAEQNALMFCCRQGLSTDTCEMHCTIAPCENCAKLLISAGIHRVVYLEEYRNKAGIELLKTFGISTKRISL